MTVSHSTSLPASNFFDKKKVDLQPSDILLFCCLRNEIRRLPFFLNYYRELGVDHFFFVDNMSNDGSFEFINNCADATAFRTDGSYKGSAAGRLWLQELCEYYGNGHWCLTVDVDELFCYPGYEQVTLLEFVATLEREQAQGVFCIFLDMYSDKALADTVYTPGSSFIDTCPFFDVENYFLCPGNNPPFLDIFGGPRGEIFSASNASARGPMMKKVPLVMWQPGFSYIFSTHSHRYIQLSATTGALLHFKFFSEFVSYAAAEAKRGDRRQGADYKQYERSIEDRTCFYSGASRKYKSSYHLAGLGMMGVSDTLNALLSERDLKIKRQSSDFVREDGGVDARHIATVWPFLNNRAISAHLLGGNVRTENLHGRADFVREALTTVSVVDLRRYRLSLHVPEKILYTFGGPRLRMLLIVDGTIRLNVSLDSKAFTFDADSLVAGILTITCADGEPALLPKDFGKATILLVPYESLQGAENDIDAELVRSPMAHDLKILNIDRNRRETDILQRDVTRVMLHGDTLKVRSRRARSTGYRPMVSVFINNRLVDFKILSQRKNRFERLIRRDQRAKFNLPLAYFKSGGSTKVMLEVRDVQGGTCIHHEELTL